MMISLTLIPILMMMLFIFTSYKSIVIYRLYKYLRIYVDNKIKTYKFHRSYTKVDVNSINET